jgi:hypothetical protein
MAANGTSALLGAAGSATATVVGGWVGPALLCLSALLLGRSFYKIYVRGVRTRATVVIAWSALLFSLTMFAWRMSS